MTLVRPEFKDITHSDFLIGGNSRLAIAHRCNAPDEHAAIVGAPVAHDFVAAMAFKVGGGEAAGECFGQLLMLFFRCRLRSP